MLYLALLFAQKKQWRKREDYYCTNDCDAVYFRNSDSGIRTVCMATRLHQMAQSLPWMLGLGRHRARAHTLVRFLFRLGRRT